MKKKVGPTLKRLCARTPLLSTVSSPFVPVSVRRVFFSFYGGALPCRARRKRRIVMGSSTVNKNQLVSRFHLCVGSYVLYCPWTLFEAVQTRRNKNMNWVAMAYETPLKTSQNCVQRILSQIGVTWNPNPNPTPIPNSYHLRVHQRVQQALLSEPQKRPPWTLSHVELAPEAHGTSSSHKPQHRMKA